MGAIIDNDLWVLNNNISNLGFRLGGLAVPVRSDFVNFTKLFLNFDGFC